MLLLAVCVCAVMLYMAGFGASQGLHFLVVGNSNNHMNNQHTYSAQYCVDR